MNPCWSIQEWLINSTTLSSTHCGSCCGGGRQVPRFRWTAMTGGGGGEFRGYSDVATRQHFLESNDSTSNLSVSSIRRVHPNIQFHFCHPIRHFPHLKYRRGSCALQKPARIGGWTLAIPTRSHQRFRTDRCDWPTGDPDSKFYQPHIKASCNNNTPDYCRFTFP